MAPYNCGYMAWCTVLVTTNGRNQEVNQVTRRWCHTMWIGISKCQVWKSHGLSPQPRLSKNLSWAKSQLKLVKGPGLAWPGFLMAGLAWLLALGWSCYITTQEGQGQGQPTWPYYSKYSKIIPLNIMITEFISLLFIYNLYLLLYYSQIHSFCKYNDNSLIFTIGLLFYHTFIQFHSFNII